MMTMKVMIDIPDNVYIALKRVRDITKNLDRKTGDELFTILMNAVMDSTPLPDDCGTLIDGERLRKRLETHAEFMKAVYFDSENQQEELHNRYDELSLCIDVVSKMIAEREITIPNDLEDIGRSK
jgi:hypothetical protein